ncbi:putative disease resistance protein RGA4 [Henckelia pumila]|uniref:putative disease resistance protein RGA4 n=1 Tax=Henckelia pumila TaxID=405737 RepID=UPI003C6DCF4E
MAEVAIDSAVQLLLGKLIAVAGEEMGVVRGFENDLKTLQQSWRMHRSGVFKKIRPKMGHRVKDVNDKLKRINDEANSYVESNSFAADPIFIGRGDVVSAIVDDMIKSRDELEISVVPIVGMGGLGKTTLTRNASLGEETVLEQIRSKLEDARYLLVLDDYVNDKRHDQWESFMNFDDCWSIIKARAFFGQPIPQDFKAIGKEIALACQGLALAANVVGGSLRGKGINDWKSFQHESGFSNSSATEDSLMKVLKISYDRLPSSLLKKCFAYCSNFSKGEKLEREILIKLWMAEGLLVGNSDRCGYQMEILGDKFYNILLQNFFLHEPIMDKYGRIKYSKMHDFVHDLSCSVENVKSANGEEVTLRARYLPFDYVRNSIMKEQTTCMLNLFLNKFEGAEFNGYIMFPDCKYLLLGCQNLRKLPKQLKFLVGLRHFAFSGFYIEILSWMPPELRNLISLRSLSYFIVSDKEGCRIDELGCLKNLEGKLRIWNLEKVGDKEESERARLSGKKNLEILKFVWSKSSREGNNKDCEVLEGLQPHPNLKGLTIKNFHGDQFPSWTMKMAVEQGNTLHKLIKIALINCKGCTFT